jgi:hypothetical protein
MPTRSWRSRGLHAPLVAAVMWAAPAWADQPDEILVTSTRELVAAMSPANRGRTIRVKAGVYCPNAPLTLPEGARIVGAGEMEFRQSLPVGFREGTTTEIVPADGGRRCPPELGSFAGSAVFNLTDGSSLRGIKVTIDLSAGYTSGGNTVMIQARGAEVIRTSISECDIQARAGMSPAAPGVAGGRAISIMTGDAPPNHDPPGDPEIRASIARSIIRGNGPTGAVVLFTIHFESRGQTSLFLHANVFTGAGWSLDLVGGVGRTLLGVPNVVEGTVTEILSTASLYRGLGSAAGGWTFTAAANSQASGSPGANANSLTFTSINDRIENVGIGIQGRAALRRSPNHGDHDDNVLGLHLIGTEISTFETDAGGKRTADLAFCPTAGPSVATLEVDKVGDRNRVHVFANGLRGSGDRENLYEHASDLCGFMVGQGTDNVLSFSGDLHLWNIRNHDIEPDPPPELFTRDGARSGP